MHNEDAPVAQLEFHPIANVFPLIEGDEFTALVEDIREHRVLEPIWLYEGKVLDGRNRYRAAQTASTVCPTREYEGDSPLQFVISLNLKRRRLNTSQRAMVAEQLATLQHGGGRVSEQAANLPVATQATVAEMLNVSERSVRAARKIRSTDTKVADLVNAGTVNLHEGSKLIALPAECRNRAIEAVVRGADIRTAVRAAKKNDHNTKIAAFRPKPLDGKYRVFYADPPWICHLNQASGIAEDHYDCLDDTQLCEYRPGGVRTVRELADKDAVLFLWVTAPMLERAFPIIEAWGFEYKTFFVWDKVKHNVGYYNSVRAELLLICTRGSCTPDTGKLIDSVQTIERSDKHSEKPREFYDIIEALYDHGRKLELFARNPRQGWDADGNESAPVVKTAAA